MTAHDTYREMLARRVELSPDEEIRLRLHLASCPECRDRADAYARQTALLRAIPPVEPPAALRARVLEVVRRPPVVSNPWWRRPVALVPLAAALLLIGIGLSVLRHPSGGVRTAVSRALTSVRATPRIIVEGTPQSVVPSAAALAPSPHHRGYSHARHAPRPAPTVIPYNSGASVAQNAPIPITPPTVGPAYAPLPTSAPPPVIHAAAGAPPTPVRQAVPSHFGGSNAKTSAPAQGASASSNSSRVPAATKKRYVPVVPAPPPVEPPPPTTLPVATVAPVPSPVPAATVAAARLAAPVRPTVTASPTATPPPTPAPATVPVVGLTATPTPTP